MVSDFIEEASADFLQHDGVEACLLLETQSEGYFESNRFLIQVNKAIDIFNSKYPGKQALDNAPSHRKRSDESLNVKKMWVLVESNLS